MNAMYSLSRRTFIAMLSACGLSAYGTSVPSIVAEKNGQPHKRYAPAHIANEYVAYLPGERDLLAAVPKVERLTADVVVFQSGGKQSTVRPGELVEGWQLVALLAVDGSPVAVLEKRLTHRGVIVFISETETIAVIPKWVGDLAQIRPRAVAAPESVQLKRTVRHVPGPDVPGNYVLESIEDPRYENVAALGPEYIGWTLVSNEQAGPQGSLYLQPDGTSRERVDTPPHASWAPDEVNLLVDPQGSLPTFNSQCWQYVEGFSKRTLLGGYLPVADLGVWNPEFGCGYELMCLLPEGVDAKPLTRLRMMVPEEQVGAKMPVWRDEHGRTFLETYPNGDAPKFFAELL
jgi:hypothetical protein